MLLLYIILIVTAASLSYYYYRDLFILERAQLISAIIISTVFSSGITLIVFYSKLMTGTHLSILWIALGIVVFIVLPISFRNKINDENIFDGFLKVFQIIVIIFGTLPFVTTVFQDLHLAYQTIIYLVIIVVYFFLSAKLFAGKIKAASPEIYIVKLLVRIGLVTVFIIAFGSLLNSDITSDIREKAHLDNYMGPVFRGSSGSNIGYEEKDVFSNTMDDTIIYDVFQTEDYVYLQTIDNIIQYDLQYNIISTVPSEITTTTIYVSLPNTDGYETVEVTTYTRPYTTDQNPGLIHITMNTSKIQTFFKDYTYKVYTLDEKEVTYSQYSSESNIYDTLEMKFSSNIMKKDIYNSSQIIGNDYDNQYIKVYENGVLTITELKPVDNYSYMYLSEIFFTYMIFAHIILFVVPFNTFESETFLLDSSKKIV